MAKKNKSTAVETATTATETAVVEATEQVVEPTEALVIDAPSDITETVEAETAETIEEVETAPEVVCSDCGAVGIVENGIVTNFSYLQATGKPRNICKPCQTAKSIEWTTKEADYRKDYARANALLKMGVPAIVPSKRTWVKGQTIMTMEYGVMPDGSIVSAGTEGSVLVPSEPAEEVLQRRKDEQKALNDQLKAERQSILDEAKEQGRLKREQEKAERDAVKAEQAKIRNEQREAEKQEKALERAEKAKTLEAERQANREAKALESQQKAFERAETLRKEREAKALLRTQQSQQKALDRAKAIAEQQQAKRAEATQKVLDALKGKQSAIVS